MVVDTVNIMDDASTTDSGEDMSPLIFIRPFLHIMMSDCTDGASTKSAISSVTKFITYNFISTEDEKCEEIVSEICVAIHNTRFIGNDSSSDETVLMKNVNLVKTLILSPVGVFMSNDAICSSIQSCFRICFQQKLSELLRSVCFSSLADIVHHIFSRLHEFDQSPHCNVIYWDIESLKMKLTKKMPIVNYKKKRKNIPKIVSTNEDDSLTNDKDRKKATPTRRHINSTSSNEEKNTPTNLFGNPKLASDSLLTKSAPTSTIDILAKCDETEAETNEIRSDNLRAEDLQSEVVSNFVNPIDEPVNQNVGSDSADVRDDDVWSLSYNVACLCEFLQYVAILIDPYDRKENHGYIVKNTVDLLHVAVESCLEHIPRYPMILDVLNDRIFFNLFQILKMNGGELLSSSINVCFILLASSRQYFPSQFENFLIILANIASSPRHTYNKREHVLDCLSQILTMPTIVSELFANFDCNPYREDVVQLLVDKLKQIIENSTKSSILREFATDNLLLIVESLAYDVSYTEKEALQQSDLFTKRKLHLINQKCKKNKAFLCCEEFNKSTSSAVALLQQFHIIEKSDHSNFNKSLGQFLYRYADRLDKKVLGEFLGKRNSGKILASYLRNCNLSNMNVEQALRLMLHYFRLPGESPVISLILDQFSAYFLELNPNSGYENHDAVFTLAYAIIMLNVDQHNENAKQTTSMNCNQFIRNVKGINNGKDFPVKMLTDIFNSIHNYEIILPEEREGFIREIYFWNRSLERTNYYLIEDAAVCTPDSENHHCYRYIIFDDHYYKETDATNGIECINVSFAYEIFQIVWQSICTCLSLSIGESPEKSRLIALMNAYSKCIRLASKAGMIDIVDDMMSKLIEFSNILNPDYSIEDVIMSIGFNVTTRITCQVAFRVVITNGDFLRDSWNVVLRTILMLFKARLLPDELLQTFDLLSDTRSSYIVQPYLSPHLSTSSKGSALTPSPSAPVLSNDNNNFFSSIYQLLVVSNDPAKPPNFDAGYEQAIKFIKDCHLNKLVWSGRNLQPESLIQKLRAIVDCYFWLENDTKSKVFLLETISRIVVDNCVRFTMIWTIIKNFYYKILTACSVNTDTYLVEKIVVTLLRILITTSQQLYNNRTDDVISCVGHFSSLLRSVVLIDSNLLMELSKHLSCGIFEHIASNCDHITSTKDWVVILKLIEIVGAGNVILNKAAMFSVPVVIPNNENSKPSTFNWTEHDAFNEANNSIWTIMGSMLEFYHSSTSESVSLNDDGGDSIDESKSNQGCITILGSISTVRPYFLPKYLQSHLKSIETLSFLTTVNSNINNFNSDSDDVKSSINYYISYCNFIPISYCLLVLAQASHNIHVELMELESIKNAAREGKKGLDISKKAKLKNSSFWSQITPENLLSTRQAVDNAILDIFQCVNNVFNIFMNNSTASPFYMEEPSSKLSYCFPFLRLFAFFCIDERENIRDHAYERMYMLLQGKHLRNATSKQWEICFNDILLPLLASILQIKSKMASGNTSTYKSTSLKVMSMIGKIFLQNISILHSMDNFEVLWLNLLQLYIDLLNSSQHDDIVLEAIPEMIKNILFVMFTLGVFEIDSCSDTVVDSLAQNAESNRHSTNRMLFFNETYHRIKHYLPSLRENLLSLVEQNSSNRTKTEAPPSATHTDKLSNNDDKNDRNCVNNRSDNLPNDNSSASTSNYEKNNQLHLSQLK